MSIIGVAVADHDEDLFARFMAFAHAASTDNEIVKVVQGAPRWL
jgi:hypothetical protein